MIPESTIKVILNMNKYRRPMFQKELSENCGVTRPRMTEIMVDLEDRKIVEEVPMKKRGKHYILTLNGYDVAILLDKLQKLL